MFISHYYAKSLGGFVVRDLCLSRDSSETYILPRDQIALMIENICFG